MPGLPVLIGFIVIVALLISIYNRLVNLRNGVKNAFSQINVQLSRLDRLHMLDKQALVSALALTISHDGKVSAHEAELLRAICATLHCPLPPFVFNAGSI